MQPAAPGTKAPAPPVPAGSARLRLRCFTPADLADVLALHTEPLVRTLLVDDQPLHEPALARHLLHRLQTLYAQHPGLGIWRAERVHAPEPAALAEAAEAAAAGEIGAEALHWLSQGQGEFCGWFSLMPMSAHTGRVEIGCRLLPTAWGGGMVLEGGTRLLEHAFGTLKLREVWAACHLEHRSVHVVLATLGFEPQPVQPYENAAAAAHWRIGRQRWLSHSARPLRQRQREAVRAHATSGAHAAGACMQTQLAWG